MATKLKLAIVNYGKPMYRLAMKAGMSESRLSRLSTGLFKPKPEEAEILSKLLNVPTEELFPEDICFLP
jgi:transcriptional regulator with XRE-family HTH domain